ncbi:hypothetical protein ACHAWF_015292 [Thalassiosira exigua]
MVGFGIGIAITAAGTLWHHGAAAFSSAPNHLAETAWRIRPGGSARTPALPMVFDASGFDADQPEQSKTSSSMIIDNIIDECLRYSARRPIMRQFDPARRSIWKHWRGTVFSDTWTTAVRNSVWALGVFTLFRRYPMYSEFLDGFNKVWAELLAVTTFTLTFFVNEAYSCWRNCLNICYTLQGRLNDFSMALAGCARRVEPKDGSDPCSVDTTSKFTSAARKILTIIGRYIRLFNILAYASFTRSHRPLLTPQGMRQMVKRGLLTEKEYSILTDSKVSLTNRHNQVLMWVVRTALDARKAGHFEGGFGFEQNILLRVQEIRSQGNFMQCVLQGRLPFGYAHIVQVLVDMVCWMYPIMAYSSGTSFQVGMLGTVFLTIAFQGLFDLSKRFLDPFHNENFWTGHDPIRVDTLIAETNAGSRRWMFGLDNMPIPLDAIQNGGDGLDIFLLPDEGYTVDDVAQMEAVEAEEKEEYDSSLLSFEEERVDDKQQSYEEEFVETQAIMSAPPGADFVPGIDDVMENYEEEEECTMFPGIDDSLPPCEELVGAGDNEQPPKQAFDAYLEAASEEYEEALRRDE